MKVLLFGAIADVVGDTSIEINNQRDTETLKQYLINKFPTLSDYNFQFALNREQVTAMMPLKEDDKVALLPPFAGG